MDSLRKNNKIQNMKPMISHVHDLAFSVAEFCFFFFFLRFLRPIGLYLFNQSIVLGLSVKREENSSFKIRQRYYSSGNGVIFFAIDISFWMNIMLSWDKKFSTAWLTILFMVAEFWKARKINAIKFERGHSANSSQNQLHVRYVPMHRILGTLAQEY